MSYETIKLECNRGVAIITLNRPEKLNSLNYTLSRELRDCMESLEKDNQLRVVVITGAGRAFSAGADIEQLRSFATPDEIVTFCRSIARLVSYIEDFPRPVIAAVNGPALGGGCEICLACDFRVAAEAATFGLPEIKLGLTPGAGGTQRLVRFVGPARAKELLLTGRTISAAEAMSWGLIDKVVANVLDEAFRLAQSLMNLSPVALRAAKQAVNHGLKFGLAAGLSGEELCFARAAGSEDAIEGVKAFLEKRLPQFRGC
ncbi:enoyl-CoA hydratase/isomerase family protein [Desulfofundulus sp. TPOSR]|uniref:enoyl-CoA hydratase/isomerase family protein n=1 Tax=Desulfofundulus sp. TPOSR TaxID=2714340 RepID=UPI00140AD216|nr:enoyl-CoA hydratase/isomerase family protein [Desulfofundulus sp. TPOSR]NHM25768.1 enoyl-CoA hydratase/isomerase family protein [Desulfofundulus sp. TPOSR]